MKKRNKEMRKRRKRRKKERKKKKIYKKGHPVAAAFVIAASPIATVVFAF